MSALPDILADLLEGAVLIRVQVIRGELDLLPLDEIWPDLQARIEIAQQPEVWLLATCGDAIQYRGEGRLEGLTRRVFASLAECLAIGILCSGDWPVFLGRRFRGERYARLALLAPESPGFEIYWSALHEHINKGTGERITP